MNFKDTFPTGLSHQHRQPPQPPSVAPRTTITTNNGKQQQPLAAPITPPPPPPPPKHTTTAKQPTTPELSSQSSVNDTTPSIATTGVKVLPNVVITPKKQQQLDDSAAPSIQTTPTPVNNTTIKIEPVNDASNDEKSKLDQIKRNKKKPQQKLSEIEARRILGNKKRDIL